MRVVVVPHTHWDREWYDPERRMRQRLTALLDAALDLLETQPQLRFHLDGQTAPLVDYFAVRPEARPRVAALVSAGRLSIGPWFVLADEVLAGDEPLIRNLLVGRADGAALGGWLPVGYSPDAFGHPGALPTILRGFGIETALLWRGYGDASVSRDLFTWVGPDGASVLTHHLPPAGYELGAELPTDRAALIARWNAIEQVLAPRAAVPVLLVLNGADHHVLQANLLDVVRTLREIAPQHEFTIGTLGDYFAAVDRACRGMTFPRVEGELRWSGAHTWTLQSVHATRTALKRAIAAGANGLTRWSEPQTALARLAGGPDRRPLLRAAWRDHLLNLSHDVLAGTVADSVAADAEQRARQVAQQSAGLLVDALHDRLGQDRTAARHQRERWQSALMLVNPRPVPRGGVVEATVTFPIQRLDVGRPGGASEPPAPIPETVRLEDAAGRTVPVQMLYAYDAYQRLDAPRAYPLQERVRAYRIALAAPDVPSLGLLRLRLDGSGTAVPTPRDPMVRAKGGGLETSGVRVRSDRRGFATSFGETGLRGIGDLVDDLDRGDTYTFDPVAGDVPRVARWSATDPVWDGPLVGVLARQFVIDDRVRGTLYARLEAGSTLLRLIIEGENQSGGHRLRILVPLVRPADTSAADMLYGAVFRERPSFQAPAFPREWRPTTAPMHRWVSAGGVTVFGRGLFEYELLERAIAVTLLRSVGDLSRGDLGARPGHAAWPVPTPGAEERGPFRAELAVAAVGIAPNASPGDWDGLERLAEEFHAPLAGWMLPHGIDVPATVEGPHLEGEGLAFKGLKPAETRAGYVLRCVNLTDRPVQGVWLWPGPVRRAFRARLDETPESDLAPGSGAGGGRIAFDAAPREVVTIVIE